MQCKRLTKVIIGIVLFFQLLLPLNTTRAENTDTELDNRQVLLVYYGEDDETKANVHFLEGTLSGMFDNVKMINFEKLKKNYLQKRNIIIFYSNRDIDLNSHQLMILNQFKGKLLGIGNGVKTLDRFKEWTYINTVTIRSIENFELSVPKEILHMKVPEDAKILAYGRQFNQKYPVIIEDGSSSFFTISDFYTEEKYVITNALFDLFDVKKPTNHVAYIRLEDISPASDPDLVLEAGNYLLDREIPVYLAVIPVYINNETGKVVKLSEVPKLTDALKSLVNRGAFVISHGYTHTYRYTETGEGFEFWDSVLNQPITTLNTEEQTEKIKRTEQFAGLEEYESYFNKYRTIETSYIETKLQSSIHSLTKLGFAPVAFEAPHYTMSSNGYKVTSNYFSAIFGQVQLSDKNWEVMSAPLFVSKPSVLNGMTLYPETIGFVDPNLDDPIGAMDETIGKVIQVPGSMLGGFYHPYLGLDYLKEMVALMQAVPNLQWLDMNSSKHFVKTDLVEVQLRNNDEIDVQSQLSWKNDVMEYLKEHPFEMWLWIIVIITAVFVVLFSIHIMNLRRVYRQRLFGERL